MDVEHVSCDGKGTPGDKSPSVPVGTFGDTLHKVLVRTIEADRSPGLLTLQFPTGTGKSYAVERTIATLASRMEEGAPPIIFVTPQKKNIPDAKAIERLCRKEGLEPGPHDVLRLLSEQEMLAETAHEGLLEDIPKAVKDKTNVEDLFDIVRHLKGTKGYGEAIRGILPEFKRSVNALFPCKGWEERLDLIENDPKWRWLADLWPSVFTKRAKVLLMTSTKFFLPHNTLIDVPKPIAGDDWIRGSVIFMDEFDSTKGYCLEAIISNSTRGRCDLAGLVRSLWHGTNVSMLPESLLAGQDGEGNAERMGKLRGVLDDVAHKTSVDYVYKATDGVIETSGLFMYDGTRRGTSFGKDYYVRTDPLRRENVIADKMKRGDGSRRLASDVNELLGAVKYAQGVIASMVRGSSSYKTTGMGEAVQNEIVSMLEAMGVKSRAEQDLMVKGVKAILSGNGYGGGSLTEGQTLYEQGFGVVAIEESEAHRFSTHIYAYAMDDTPERMLLSLIEDTLVIGLSATARIDSPLCNYDLAWLAEQRPSLMRLLDEGDVWLLEEAYDRHIKGYDKVDLRVVPIEASHSSDASIYKVATQIVKKQHLVENVANLLDAASDGEDEEDEQNNDTSNYCALRYARVTRAYRYFLENVPVGVFVCATTAAPRRGDGAKAGYRVETLEQLFEMVRRDLDVLDDGAVRFIEDSVDFESSYQRMVGDLGEGCPRLFVCASYGSLATGVNLQYDGKGMKTVSVNDFSFDPRVDLVGVYLDSVTNIAPTKNRIRSQTLAEDSLRCAFELREMAWHGDISIDEMDSILSLLMGGRSSYVKLKDKSSVMVACTRTIVQMVGRMCRTSNKAPTIHILFDEELAGSIDPYAMGHDLVSVETERLLGEVASRAGQKPESQGRTERMLACRTVTTASWLSSLARRGSWAKKEMKLWDDMRQWCVGHPCPRPGEVDGTRLSSCYMDVGREVKCYWYSNVRDFESVEVSFDVSSDLPLEVSDRAARLDVLECIPEIERLFEREGWPMSWEGGTIVMNPALFQNVYLGAIGELAGKEVLETRIRGLVLEPITDPAKFEKFDFVVAGTDVYVDFKHWRSPDMSGTRYIDWVREKMRKVGATHALIANLVSSEELRDKRCEEIGKDILSVPYLIDDVGTCVSEGHMGVIRSWFRKVGVLQ